MIIKLPGLIDCHVHLRVPGGEHKEDFSSGSKAAIAGGFTTILAMPNTQPPLTRLDLLLRLQAEAKKKAYCNILFFAGASPNEIHQLPELSNQAVALKIYMNDTFGLLRMNKRKDLERCLRIWGMEKPVAVHAEGEKIDLAIELCRESGSKIHFCHVSRKTDIEKIAKAKQLQLPVTCEVSPHHLFLTDKDAVRLGPFGYMKPLLGTAKDRDALWAHIEETIDCIGTDHAPHTAVEKMLPAGGPPGVPGLETALPLMITAVTQERLTIDRLISLMFSNPARIFHVPTAPATWIEVDVEKRSRISGETLFTKCAWSPFEGMEVTGTVQRVVMDGLTVFERGKFFIKESDYAS